MSLRNLLVVFSVVIGVFCCAHRPTAPGLLLVLSALVMVPPVVSKRPTKDERKGRGRPESRVFIAARLGAQLARENVGRYAPLNEIARHTETLVAAAFAIRSALERGKDPAPHYDAARTVAHLYYANVVERNDPAGPVLGLKFSSSQFSGGDENIFFVA